MLLYLSLPQDCAEDGNIRVQGSRMFAASRHVRRRLNHFSLSLTSTAEGCGGVTKAVDWRVSIGRSIPVFCIEPAVAWGRSLPTPCLRRYGHQRAITYLDRKSVVPYSRAVQPCGIQLRETRPCNQHQPNPGPGRQVTRPRGQAAHGGREPAPSHPGRTLYIYL